MDPLNCKVKILLIYFICTLTFLISEFSQAADLVINGENNRVYENGNYNKLIVSNSSNIQIRNSVFSSNSGRVVSITSSNNISIEDSEINGNVHACTGVLIGSNSSDIYIKNSTIHDIADDGMELYNSDHLYIIGNEIFRLYGVGTDSGGTCYNGHSDGIEISGVSNSTFSGNLIYDVRGTSAFYLANSGTNSNISVINNIFYSPESGFAGYAQNTNGVKFYNNVFWQGKYGGIAIRDNVTNLEFYNNVTHSINYNHFGTSQKPDHYIDYNLLAISGQGYILKSNDLIETSPFKTMHEIGGPIERNIKATDFALKDTSLGINSGIISSDTPLTDYFGYARIAAPEMGAIEHGTNGQDKSAPNISTIQAIAISQDKAIITWETDELTDGQVVYGITESYDLSTDVNTNLREFHSVELTNLHSNTQYHYQVKSRDSSGNLTISNDLTFTTLADDENIQEISVSQVYASSDDGHSPTNTIDNDLSTRWSAQGAGEWIEFDLGSENRITMLSIAFYSGTERIMQFEIWGSIDGNLWVPISNHTSSGITLQQEEFQIQKTVSRYVRIVGYGNSSNDWNSITEVDIYGLEGKDEVQPPITPSILPAILLLID